MSDLHRDGVIETRNRRIAILNRDALSRRASGLSVVVQLPIQGPF